MPADSHDSRAELDRLRRQVESAAADPTSPALATAGAAVTSAGAVLDDLAARVRRQPLAAVLVAVAAGYAFRAVTHR